MNYGAGRAIGMIGALGAVIAVLTTSGTGSLAGPASGESWSVWLQQRDAITVVFAAVRAAALVAAWYLAVATALVGSAAVVRSKSLSTLTSWVTTPAVRAALHSALGVSLATTAMIPMWLTPDVRGVVVAHAATLDPPVLEPTSPAARNAAVPTRQGPAPPGAPAPQRAAPRGRPPASSDSRWQVRPGDHFWSITVTHLSRVSGEEPSDDVTARYWARLVEHNRGRLADRSNPDLLFVGQVIELVPLESDTDTRRGRSVRTLPAGDDR